MKMHENEFVMTDDLVRNLLHIQCPEWATLSLKRIQSSGTDNALYRLGDKYVVRLPRVEWVRDGIQHNIDKEYTWLPKIAGFLKTPISEPIFNGEPTEFYPWPWIVTKWCEGLNPEFEKEDEYHSIAIELANFLNDFHEIKIDGGPSSRRGVPLLQLDNQTRKAINELEGEIDVLATLNLWEKLSNIPYWDKPAVWVHGDFLPGNILIKDSHLSGVIDFSDVGMGDPACDLVIAWALFNRASRDVFREALANMDDATWERGRGWALSIALIMLPYYKNTNLALTNLARHIISHIE